MQSAVRRLTSWRWYALTGVLMLALSGCVAQYRNHGYVPPAEELAKIKLGVDTRDSVVEAIGAPTSSGVLNDSGYYYISTRVRNYGLRAPQIVDRQLVAINFDSRGVVRNIERYGLEDGRAVPLDRRVTDSGLSNNGFLRQLVGNLGNFNPGTFLQQ
jgi:outer membrane protein assembly factor BamE (lipoprotein component of BamABCDE complex)